MAAAYLARADKTVLVLERHDHVGGAAVSERPWEGVDARLSRYSYLVSLLPRSVREELGLTIELRRRSVSSYSPRPDGSGLLVRTGEPPHANWAAFQAMTGRVAEAVFPTADAAAASRARSCARGSVTTPPGRRWSSGRWARRSTRYFEDDLERGIIATDALIGTFAGLDDESLRQNRCFLYHVIGNGTGDWDVPVGGMGALTEALAGIAYGGGRGAAARRRGDLDRDRRRRRRGALRGRLGERAPRAGQRRAGRARAAARANPSPIRRPRAPSSSSTCCSRGCRGCAMSRSTRARRSRGRFHVNESATQLAVAYAQAHAGRVPELAPCEVYCHSLTDPSILGARAARRRGRRR